MQPVLIVGGGISGLSAAYYLSRLSRLQNKSIGKIILIESTNRFGGWVDTFRNKNGVLHELGPRSLRKTGQSKGEITLQLINELGIVDDVLIKSMKDPNVSNKYVATADGLAKIPTRLLSLIFKQKPFSKPFYKFILNEFRTPKLDLTSRSLDYLGDERAFIERNQELLDEQLEDTSIHDFIRSRIGDEVANYLFDPLLRGMTSGDVRTLSVRSLLEEMFTGEREFGSILKGMLSRAQVESKAKRMKEITAATVGKKESDLPAKLKTIDDGTIWSFKDGMAQLPRSMLDYLSTDSNVELRLNSSLKGFKVDANGELELSVENGNQTYQIKSDQVFFALNAIDLARLVPEDENLRTIKRTLDSIRSASIATVSLEINKKNLLNKYPGFGFLIPSHVNSSMLGVVFDSQVFPELNNSNEITRLSVMAGGDWFSELCKSNGEFDESRLVERTVELLRKYLEINDDPSFMKVNVLKNCIPQYRVGHYLKLKLLDKEINENKLKLCLIGSSYSGVSLNDCIYNSRQQVDSYLNKMLTL